MTDRKVQLEISKDGGHTWPIKREQTLGELGQYTHTPRFRRFGHADRFTAKIRVTSPIRADHMGAFVDYEVSDK